MLVPHRREDPEFRETRDTSDQFEDALILVRLEPVGSDEFGGDLGLVHGSLLRKIGGRRKGLLWCFFALSRALQRPERGPGFAQCGWIGFNNRNPTLKASWRERTAQNRIPQPSRPACR